MRKLLPGASALLFALAAGASGAFAAQTINGGALKSVIAVVAVDTDHATPLATFGAVPGAIANVVVFDVGETVVATFTAECRLTGSTNPALNFVEIQVRDGLSTILPTGGPATGTPVAFCSDSHPGSYSVTVAQRLPVGAHDIRVFTKLTKGNGDVMTANIDDWSLTVLVTE